MDRNNLEEQPSPVVADAEESPLLTLWGSTPSPPAAAPWTSGAQPQPPALDMQQLCPVGVPPWVNTPPPSPRDTWEHWGCWTLGVTTFVTTGVAPGAGAAGGPRGEPDGESG